MIVKLGLDVLQYNNMWLSKTFQTRRIRIEVSNLIDIMSHFVVVFGEEVPAHIMGVNSITIL
jgi:hypothetical protein